MDAIHNATTLDELLMVLLDLTDDESKDTDTSSLPTFGGKVPKDTALIYSWDKTRLLVNRGDGWETELRAEYVEDHTGETAVYAEHCLRAGQRVPADKLEASPESDDYVWLSANPFSAVAEAAEAAHRAVATFASLAERAATRAAYRAALVAYYARGGGQ